jgi:hypothetical protein
VCLLDPARIGRLEAIVGLMAVGCLRRSFMLMA